MFRVAVLCSHRAPGLVALLDRDARRGSAYEVVCCVTSSDTFAEAAALEARGVPCVAHSIRAFCRERGARLGDLDVRAAYDAATVALLSPVRPDLIVLDGYLLLLTAPFLDRFAHRTVNIHHSDLALRDGSGAPRYPGLRAVRDALLAGERETRATAHLVTATLDEGPVLVRSWPFVVAPVVRWARRQAAHDVLRAFAFAHQEWMLRTAWPPMLACVIQIAATLRRASGGTLDLRAAGEWELTEAGTLLPAQRATPIPASPPPRAAGVMTW
ncbi:MAG TPA: formyltransferase family protein [Vicinamibacterales bacterium]|nr:formyltransferase family protein [Vicinamibacterales bacterium]